MTEPSLWNIILDLLDHRWVRAFSTVLAVVSAGVGLWAARKAQKVLHTHEQQILVLQVQSLNEQWQRLDSAVLSNDSAARTVAGVLGTEDIEQFRRHTLFQFLVNLLSQAWASKERGTITDRTFGAHFASVAYYFRNREELFFQIAIESEYSPSFVEECKRRFAKLKRLTLKEMGDDIRAVAHEFDSADAQPGAPAA